MRKAVLWCTAGLLVCGSGDAAAQDVPAQPSGDEATPSSEQTPTGDPVQGGVNTAPPGQAAAPGLNPEDIVVTALRSAQNIQRTPAAVTVVGGELLRQQQIVDVRGIQNLVPAARFSAANTSTRIFIRGVGSALDFYWIPETTATNLNGVYIPRFGTTAAFFDVDSVQVLPGPQGVLYGRSAGGGAVLINTRRPVFEEEAYGLLEYGNYDSLRVEAAGNVPLSEKVAVRVAGVVNRHDGYESFGLQANDSYGVRLSTLFRPSEQVSLFLWGSLFEQNGRPTAAQYLPLADGVDPWTVPAVDPVTRRSNVLPQSRTDFEYKIAGYDLALDLGGFTVDYLGSVARQTERSLRKLIGNDQVLDNAQTQYVQNLHFSGRTGGLEFVGGVDWFYARSRFNSQLGPNRLGSIFPTIRQRSLSGFAQGTLSVTDALRIVAGVRYTRDSLRLEGTNIRCFGPCVLPPVTFRDRWRNLDLKGGIEVDLAARVLGYANVQTGYAPGSVNTVVANNVIPPAGVSREIRPQKLLAYTAGLKSSIGEGLLTLNLEGFYYHYRRLIIQSFVAALNQQTLFNAPRARVYGLQLTSTLRPSENDVLTANVAYTNGRYDDFQATPVARNIGGLQMVYTPDWTATLAYDRRFPLANGARVDARVSTYISSSYWGTFDHSAAARQDAYTRSDASIFYRAPGELWSVGAWIKNIEDEPVATAPAASGYAAPYSAAAFLEPPRTYGVSLGFRF